MTVMSIKIMKRDLDRRDESAAKKNRVRCRMDFA